MRCCFKYKRRNISIQVFLKSDILWLVECLWLEQFFLTKFSWCLSFFLCFLYHYPCMTLFKEREKEKKLQNFILVCVMVFNTISIGRRKRIIIRKGKWWWQFNERTRPQIWQILLNFGTINAHCSSCLRRTSNESALSKFWPQHVHVKMMWTEWFTAWYSCVLVHRNIKKEC